MSTGRLLLVRHGQTTGNGQRYVGWEDVPLCAAGVAQARAAAEALAGERIDALYASPLARAVETARPLSLLHGLPIVVRQELKEIDYGRFQGVLKADRPLALRHAHRFAAMPGGESLHDVFVRVQRLAAELVRELRACRTVVVVGHFWSNRMLVGSLCDVRFEDVFVRTAYKPRPGSIYELVCGNGGVAQIATAQWYRPRPRRSERAE